MSGSAFSVTPQGGFAEPAPALGGTVPTEALGIQLLLEKNILAENAVWSMETYLVVTATGGDGDYEYVWTKTGGDAEMTLLSESPGVIEVGSDAPASPVLYSSTWELTVTDGTGATITQEYTLQHDWIDIPSSGGGGGGPTLQMFRAQGGTNYTASRRIETANQVAVYGDGGGQTYEYTWTIVGDLPPEVVILSESDLTDTLILQSFSPGASITYVMDWIVEAYNVDTEEVITSEQLTIEHRWFSVG